MKLIPFLSFPGTTREALAFYATALGGTIVSQSTYGETPMCDQTPADTHHWIAHAQLEAGGAILMAADCPPQQAGEGGTTVNIDVETIEEAERIFAALSEGADVRMPMAETFWAHRWGFLVDRYGKPWMVNCVKPH